MSETADGLRRRLIGLAAALDLPGLGPRVEEAVLLALDLLVADMDTPATVAVASLGKGATPRDSGEEIRLMLLEQGTSPPSPMVAEATAYTTTLWAVALGGISVGEFSSIFYNYLPGWDEQDPIQRDLVLLLHEWHHLLGLPVAVPVAVQSLKTVAGRQAAQRRYVRSQVGCLRMKSAMSGTVNATTPCSGA